jgi:iron complex outermembrane receptor protein
MIKNLFYCFIAVLISSSYLFASGGGIKGTITDSGTGEALVGANVLLQGTNIGAATDDRGVYSISNIPAGEYVLTVSYIGYSGHSESVNIRENSVLTVDVQLKHTEILGDQVIVSASRKPEKITDAPASIGLISSKDLEEYAGNSGELFGRLKGVDYIRTGVSQTGLNVRGFNSAFNPKILELSDNKLATLIATGLAFGPMNPPIKEDIDRVEVILGPSAALYGPNAHNGLINVITKDPRSSQGTIVALGGGSQSVMDGRVRHAEVLSDKFAYKVSAEYTKGIDYNFTDSVYIGGKGFDEVGKDRNFNYLHGTAEVVYTPVKDNDIIFSYGGSRSNFLSVTNAGRNMIKDWTLHIGQVRYVSPRIFAQAYYTISTTENTFAINQRTQNYWSFKNAGFSEEEALRRSFTQQWAGASPSNGVALNRGAVFKDDSRRLNSEIQYNNNWGGFNVIVGGQYQLDMAGSKGTYLIDNGGRIDIRQYGFYGQIEKELGSGFKAIVAARADDHELYGFNFIPKAGLLYTTDAGTFRVTYGKGIAAPTILNLDMNLFGGLVLGNGVGFTLSDGSKIAPLKVETINTIEAGYKGVIDKKLFVDVNGYYNISENFISPLTNIAPKAFAGGPLVTKRGDEPISKYQPGLGVGPGDYVLTYLNFGKVNTYGIDVGLNYYFDNHISLMVNYSFFDFSMDTNDPKNDGNKDGKVDVNDLPLNTPKHKIGVGLNYSGEKFFGSVFGRWAQKYNFFSGINVRSETIPGLTYGGDPVVQGQRVGRDWNYGPLGGFFNVDLSAGYRVSDVVTISGSVANLFDVNAMEFVASPPIGRLFNAEVKFSF